MRRGVSLVRRGRESSEERRGVSLVRRGVSLVRRGRESSEERKRV